jgi:thiosulfate/3-mercaptopyruvate sulfurtransferase
MSLLSPEDLLTRLGQPTLRICDVRWWLVDPPRGRRAYDEGHVPGAVFIDVDTDLVAAVGPGRHPLPDRRAFARRLEELGISDDSEVVAYDDAGGAVAARLWWMLDDLGHSNVSVLDGGFPAWLAAGGPVATEVPTYDPGHLNLRDRWTRTIDQQALVDRLVADDLALVDARAP